MTRMYLLLVLLLVGLSWPDRAYSQNCFSLKIDHQEASPGDTVFLNVSATGFQGVLSMQYSLNWNAEEIQLLGVNNFNLPGLSEANFGLVPAQLAEGKLTTSWFDPNIQGLNRTDDSTLYTLAFRVTKIEAERTFVHFSDQPTISEIGFLGDRYEPLSVGIAGAVHLKSGSQNFDPLLITDACALTTSGGQIFVNVSGGTAPYAYDWDGPGNFRAETQNLDSLSAGAYNLRVIDSEGAEAYARFHVGAQEGQEDFFTGIAITCSDTTTTLFAATFGLDSSTLIFNWSNGVIDTSTNFTSSIEVPLAGVYNVTVTDPSGNKSVSESIRPAEFCENKTQILALNVPDLNTSAFDTVTVPVYATDFKNITQLSFSLGWDHLGLEVIQATPNPALVGATITYDSLNLAFNWTASQGQTLNFNDPILTLELAANFTAGKATIAFQSFPNALFAQGNGSANIALITNDGSVTISDQAPIHLNIASGIGAAGEELCLPVTVAGFRDIVGMQFQLAWDTTALSFSQVRGFSLPQFSENNFGVATANDLGKLKMSWGDNTLAGQNLPDNTALFEVCFTPVTLEDTTTIRIDETNFPVEFITKDLLTLGYTSGNGTAAIIQKVWPGDSDINGVVNHFDLFNIGLAYGATGPKRAGDGINWNGYFSIPWNQSTPDSQVDYRFSDTNGDGLINTSDLDAINQNWGRTYEIPLPGFSFLEPRRNGAPLFIEADTLYTGAQVSLPIHLGTEDNPAQDVYSIGFSIQYDPSLIEPGSFSFSLDDSWLKTQGSDLLQVAREYPSEGRIDIAITRTDGQNISGFGIIGRSSVTIEDVIFGVRDGKPTELRIDHVRTINAQEEEASVAPQTTTTIVELASATVQLLPDHLVQVYPVPTQALLQVQLPENLKVERLQLFDLNGRQLLNEKPTGLTHDLDLSAFSTGIYQLKVVAKSGVLIKRVSKN